MDAASGLNKLHLQNSTTGINSVRDFVQMCEDGKMGHLGELGASNCGLNKLEDRFFNAISILSLDVSSNGLGLSGAQATADAAKSLPVLAALNISDNLLNSECAEILAPAIQEMKRLTSLDISHNTLVDGENIFSAVVRTVFQRVE